MNEFNKGRGLSITSGILFLAYIIIDNINFFKYIDYNSTLTIIINFALYIIPILVLGIMLIVGKMHYGFLVPVILMIILYAYDIIRISIEYFHVEFIIACLLMMIPWIFMLIVFIMSNKPGEKSPGLKVLCFIPTVITVITFILSLCGWGLVLNNTSGLFWTLLVGIIMIGAFALFGVWIFVNVNSDNVYEIPGQYGRYPQPGMGQPVYPQSRPYYPQQPAPGYQQPYAPQYNQQPANYQQGMAQPYGQPQYNQQYQQPQFNQAQYQQPQYASAPQPGFNQPAYQQSSEPQPVFSASNEADMIKSYKELLDNGTITQEEFDQKKKQILGL